MAGGTDGTNLYKIAFSDADPGFLSRIPYPNFYSFRIPDPRSRISDPGSKNSNKREGWENICFQTFFSVLRIHDILGVDQDPDPAPQINASDWWIRIRIRIRILLFASLTFKMQAKNKFFNTIFSTSYFLKLHLHHFSKTKSQNESQNSRNQVLSYYFCRW